MKAILCFIFLTNYLKSRARQAQFPRNNKLYTGENMEKLIAMLEKRIAVDKSALNQALKDNDRFEKGYLRVSFNNNRPRFYQVKDKSGGKYLKKSEIKIAKNLAQKRYQSEFVKNCYKEIDYLEKVKKKLETNNLNLIYDNLSEVRKTLVNPYILDKELSAIKWQNKRIQTTGYLEENKVYDTKRGEKVRSKSEALIADILYDLGIPYHYEKALRLKNGETRYPDFTLYNKNTRKEVYYEHFGLLDDREYLKASLKKIDEYQKNDIYLGKNLIFSFETNLQPFNISRIRKMLKEVMT